MKFAVFAAMFSVSLAATCTLFGWLESSVNMIEGLKQFFQPGAGTIVFSPILLLFIALGLGVFVGVSLLAVVAAAVLGGVVCGDAAYGAGPHRWRTIFSFLSPPKKGQVVCAR